MADASAGWRLPAPMIESLVVRETCRLLKDRPRLIDALNLARLPANRMRRILSITEKLEDRLRDDGPEVQRELLQDVIDRIEVCPGSVWISYRIGKLRALIGVTAEEGDPEAEARFRLEVPVQMKRRGAEMRLVLGDARDSEAMPDPVLIKIVAQGHGWFEELRSGKCPSVGDLVAQHGVSQGDISRRLPLAFLAPDIVATILDGRQPVELTAARLVRIRGLPLSWAEQRRVLGFPG